MKLNVFFGNKKVGSLHENVTALYIYAKTVIDDMLAKGEITLSNDENSILPWIINNQESFELLKKDLELVRDRLEQKTYE